MKPLSSLLIAALFWPALSHADSVRPNAPIVAAGDDGSCYARSVPDDAFGQAGTTTIYSVATPKDIQTAVYDWYSLAIYLNCNVWRDGSTETTVVRVGPWPIGMRANSSDLALAFYKNGKLLKEYSTLDIAGTPRNVRGSVSHYSVFSSIDGFKWQDDGEIDFIAVRVDGKRLRFSSSTGALVDSGAKRAN